jgi:hypothetical protein
VGHARKKKGEGGWAGPEERREGEKRDLFFSNSFSTFQTFEIELFFKL